MPPDSAPPAASAASGHGAPIHTHCENCGTPLAGPFCHKCGQHDFEFHRSFGHVFLDALENFFHFDAKLFRNLVTLLFRPGTLTAEFNSGHRAAQMPPFRLYLFVSVLFFFVSFVIGTRPGNAVNFGAAGTAARQSLINTALADALRDTSLEPDPTVRARRVQAIRRLQENVRLPGADIPELPRLTEAIDEEVKRIAAEEGAAPAPAGAPRKPAASYGDSETKRELMAKTRYALTHQEELAESFIHAVPKILLVCVPFFALYTRVLFRKARQVYLQHLVVALHFHTFIFLWVLLRNGWGGLVGFASPQLRVGLGVALTLWMVVYPFLMFRRLFGGSWLMTVLKTVVMFFVYSLTIAGFFFLTAAGLFLLL